ncbi:MAG: hypothetical protein DSY58_02635 [Desulfobulbus sp.]|nr:MAG: hypothetical protein DSY58_02635 [Desulfobulbus sp.]
MQPRPSGLLAERCKTFGIWKGAQLVNSIGNIWGLWTSRPENVLLFVTLQVGAKTSKTTVV